MRAIMTAMAVLLSVTAAMAERVSVPSNKGATETMDALVAAVEGAGATVFARVDHAGGADSIDAQLRPTELLIFGNPRLGTPAMQDAQVAGLYLPLRVLVHEDESGAVFLTYDDPAAMLTAAGVPADAPYLAQMAGALGKLTGAAAQ